MPTHNKGVQAAGWINIVLGALILLTPFFTGQTTGAPLWNGVLAGALAIVLAGTNAYFGNQRTTERAYGPAIVNVLVGIWVLVSGFVLAVGAAYAWSMGLFGLLLAVSAGYNTWAASDARRTTMAT